MVLYCLRDGIHHCSEDGDRRGKKGKFATRPIASSLCSPGSNTYATVSILTFAQAKRQDARPSRPEVGMLYPTFFLKYYKRRDGFRPSLLSCDSAATRTRDPPDLRSGCSIQLFFIKCYKRRDGFRPSLLSCDSAATRTRDPPDLRSGCSIQLFFYKML
jgi:hypothetical protein